MPDYTAIIKAISEMQKSHKDCMDSLKEEMYMGLRATTTQIDSEMEVVNLRLKELVDHVARQNSNVAKLQDESNKRMQAVIDFRALESKHKKRDEWIRKNLIWLIPAFILLIAGIIIAVELVGAKVVFERAIDKLSQTIK
jgi:predicted nuclease with TOPRIM domain